MVAASAKIHNSTILQPCFIGENAEIMNCVIGPYVSIGAGTKINTSVIHNSIIQNNSKISDVVLKDSMIGNFVELGGSASDINIGDYSRQAL